MRFRKQTTTRPPFQISLRLLFGTMLACSLVLGVTVFLDKTYYGVSLGPIGILTFGPIIPALFGAAFGRSYGQLMAVFGFIVGWVCGLFVCIGPVTIQFFR